MALDYINTGAVAAMNGLAEVKRKYRSTSEHLPKKLRPKAQTDLSDDSSSINGAQAELKPSKTPKWQSVWDVRTDKGKKKRKQRSKEARDDSDPDNDFVGQDGEYGNHQVDGPRSPPPVDRSKKPKRPTASVKPPSITDERDSRPPPPRPPLPNLNSQLQVDATVLNAPIEVPKLPKGKKLLDLVVPKDLETLQRSMFENETFFEIVTKKTYDDVKNFSVSPWVASGGERRRQMSYNFPKTIAFSTHDIHIEQIQIQASYSQPGVVYGIDCVTKNRGVMYSDYFEVHIHFRLSAETQASSRLIVTADIVFVKPCLFKSKIETEGWSGLKKYYEMVEKEVQNEKKAVSSNQNDPIRPPIPKRSQNQRAGSASGRVGNANHPDDSVQLGAGLLNVAFIIVIVILSIITFAMFRLSSSMVALNERLNSIEDMIERYALVCHTGRTAR